jgi:hypothetical protein
MLRRFIQYSSPDGGQSLRSHPIQKAWDGIVRFLEFCTDATAPESRKLVLFEGIADEASYYVAPILEELTQRWGPTKRCQWCYGARECYNYEWSLSSEQDQEARELLQGRSWPESELGPVQLVLSYRFRWIDPCTRIPLPFQDKAYLVPAWKPESSLLVFLQPHSRVILEGHFPFESPDERFRSYVEVVKPVAPFRLIPRHFRLLIPNKRGTTYIARRIDPMLHSGA